MGTDIKYHNHHLEISYKVDSKYFVYWLEIKVDGDKVFKSKQYELPESLYTFRWFIDEIPVVIDYTEILNLTLYWKLATGPSIQDHVEIKSLLALIDRALIGKE